MDSGAFSAYLAGGYTNDLDLSLTDLERDAKRMQEEICTPPETLDLHLGWMKAILIYIIANKMRDVALMNKIVGCSKCVLATTGMRETWGVRIAVVREVWSSCSAHARIKDLLVDHAIDVWPVEYLTNPDSDLPDAFMAQVARRLLVLRTQAERCELTKSWLEQDYLEVETKMTVAAPEPGAGEMTPLGPWEVESDPQSGESICLFVEGSSLHALQSPIQPPSTM